MGTSLRLLLLHRAGAQAEQAVARAAASETCEERHDPNEPQPSPRRVQPKHEAEQNQSDDDAHNAVDTSNVDWHDGLLVLSQGLENATGAAAPRSGWPLVDGAVDRSQPPPRALYSATNCTAALACARAAAVSASCRLRWA